MRAALPCICSSLAVFSAFRLCRIRKTEGVLARAETPALASVCPATRSASFAKIYPASGRTQPADTREDVPSRYAFWGPGKLFPRASTSGPLKERYAVPENYCGGRSHSPTRNFGDTCLGKGPNTEPEVLYFLRLFRYLRHPAVPRNHRVYCVRFRTPRSTRFFACAAFSSVHLLSRCILPLFRPRFLKGGGIEIISLQDQKNPNAGDYCVEIATIYHSLAV